MNSASRSIPRATYRVQLHREFTFEAAARLVPYLSRLGISHLYTSPILKARPGSPHGYDVTDHTQLNPDLGSEADFRSLIEVLHRHGMGLIVDIVPNHLGIMGNDNVWWLDVLENGAASQFAGNFDIDWYPNRSSLHGRLLVPVLGEPYGATLEKGDIQLRFDGQRGEFSLHYFDHRFPVDPREYPRIFAGCPADTLDEETAADFLSLMNSFAALPTRGQTTAELCSERYRDKEAHKRRLVRLIERSPAVLNHIESVLAAMNGQVGDAASFDALDALHEAQAYRLAYWRVAADEINYRRFFDVNSLAALRMNDRQVFADTHALIGRFVADGSIDGLRIDHSDGLFDPEAYFARLREYLSSTGPLYVVTEKILATHERLPETWQVQGTTGYEFGALTTAWLVDPAGETPLTRMWRHFVEATHSFDELAYHARKLVMRIMLAPEVEALATQLDRLAQLDRYTADFTRPALREAIVETIACFPVYRTYLSERGVRDEDRRTIDWALSVARKRSSAADVSVFDFLRQMLLAEPVRELATRSREAILEFAMKFQQVTAPVTAKGVEDTALYRFNRLICLNEVGSDPRRFSVSSQAIHQENAERARAWPLAMLATSTHDTKRSEDVRARIAVLSEVPGLWRQHVARWSRLNRSRRRIVNDTLVPDRDDEYLLYQTLLGVHEPGMDESMFSERLADYMVKAAREAKRSTSWLNVDPAYEEGLRGFVAALLAPRARNAFMHDFLRLAPLVRWFGHFNSLSMLALKLFAPGIPDIYQGCERPVLSLVDPDNRRAVDFGAAERRLDMLLQRLTKLPRREVLASLLAGGADGDAKLFLTHALLAVRRQHPLLFSGGRYQSLIVTGEYSEHLFAASRIDAGTRLTIVVPRWMCKLMNGALAAPIGAVWGNTALELPEDAARGEIREVLSDRSLTPDGADGRQIFKASEILADFPVAVFSSAGER